MQGRERLSVGAPGGVGGDVKDALDSAAAANKRQITGSESEEDFEISFRGDDPSRVVPHGNAVGNTIIKYNQLDARVNRLKTNNNYVCNAIKNINRQLERLESAIKNLGIKDNDNDLATKFWSEFRALKTSLVGSQKSFERQENETASVDDDTVASGQRKPAFVAKIERLVEEFSKLNKDSKQTNLQDFNTKLSELEKDIQHKINVCQSNLKVLTTLTDLLWADIIKWKNSKTAAAASAAALLGAVASLGIYDAVNGTGPVTELGELVKAVGVDGLGSSFETGMSTLGVSTALALVIGLAICQGIKASLTKSATKVGIEKVEELKEVKESSAANKLGK